MTFEIKFNYNDIPFKADVTSSGKDLLVNLTSPVHYEATPTITFTLHDDESMKYDNTLFDDKEFMPVIEKAIINYIHLHNVVVE
jgi:hypothetical protein